MPKRPHAPTDQPQICRVCEVRKPAEEYYPDKQNKTGRNYACKACMADYARVQRNRVQPERNRPAGTKTCKSCSQDLSTSQYDWANRMGGNRLNKNCRKCAWFYANSGLGEDICHRLLKIWGANLNSDHPAVIMAKEAN